jgi:hypothetical protein
MDRKRGRTNVRGLRRERRSVNVRGGFRGNGRGRGIKVERERKRGNLKQRD